MPATPEWQYGAIAYLLQCDQSTSLDEQQQHIGCTPAQLKWLRSKLIKQGKLMSRRPRWSGNEDEDMIDGLRAGLSLHRVSRRLTGRTPRAIKDRAREHGGIHEIRTGDDAIQTISAVRSASQVAALLGISWKCVKWLIEQKALKYNRASYTQPKGRTRNWQYYVADDALMELLDDQRYWMLIDPAAIKDEDWRAYAEQARELWHQSQIDTGVLPFDALPGRWIAAPAFATALDYTSRQGSMWCRRGVVPATLVRGVWYLWSGDPAVLTFWQAHTTKPL